MTQSPKSAGGDDAVIVLERLSLDLNHLRREGAGPYQVQADLPTIWLADVLRETDAAAPDPGHVSLEVTVQGDHTVLLRGHLELTYSVPCARCLSPAVVDAGGDLCLTAVPAAQLRRNLEAAMQATSDPEGVEVDPQSLDEVGYEGHVIDLGQILGEQAMLAYPIRALCGLGEACEGLCSACGRNVAEVRAGRVACDTCQGDPDRANSAHTEGEANTSWKDALRKLTQS